MKKCPACEQTLDSEFFYGSRHTKSGLSAYCKVCNRLRSKRYRQENEARVKEQIRQWHEDHKESVNIYKRNWELNNRDKIRPMKRKSEQSRRARKLNQFVEIVDPLIVYARDNGVCQLCWDPVGVDFHIDHILPLSKGGEHSYKNTQLTHPQCNLSKGSRVS